MSWRAYRSYLGLAYRVWRTQGGAGLVQAVRRRLQSGRSSADWTIPRVPPAGATTFRFQPAATPEVSVLILGREPVSLDRCLQSLAAHEESAAVEVMVIVTGADIDTARLQQRGIKIAAPQHSAPPSDTWAAAAADLAGRYVLLLADNMLVTRGWLQAMLATFACHANVGVVVPRVVSEHGRLLAAGVQRTSGVGWAPIGAGGEPFSPEYSYARDVDGCLRGCVFFDAGLFRRVAPALARESLADVGIDAGLSVAVRDAGRRIVYQPAVTMVSSDNAVVRAVDDDGAIASQPCHQERQRSDHVLIIDSCVPTPDRDSGSLRMWNLLQIFQQSGFRVTFSATNLDYLQPYTTRLQSCGVEMLYRPFVRAIESHLREIGQRYSVILLSHPETGETYTKLVRALCPAATLVYDTVDLRYVREEREATLYRSAGLKRSAARRKRAELEIMRQSDITWVVSAVEQDLLKNELPDLRVEVVSNIVEPREAVRGFDGRKDLLFLGNYRHPPNVDAAKHLVADLFPLIKTRLPGVRLFIVGSHAGDNITALASDDVIVTGYVEDLEPYFSQCRVFVAPLRYGAGVKGKLNMSMSYGLPIVGSAVAVEGMDLDDGRDVMVADEPSIFADKVAQVYQDADLWQRLSTAAMSVLQNSYSRAVPKAAIERLKAAGVNGQR